MKQKQPVVTHTNAHKKYIEQLTIPGRQGAYQYKPVRRLVKFNKSKLPKDLFDSMENVHVSIERLSLEFLCGISCINIQRDVELHKEKLLHGYLTGKTVNYSTVTELHLAYIKETDEYLIIDGNTRLALCRDELMREIDEMKTRRFKIPEYFNAIVHTHHTQEEAEQAYKTYDNSNATESPKQKLQGALYAAGHTDWLSHPILRHCSYSNVMEELLQLNGVKNAQKLTVFEMLDYFEEDLTYLYENFNYELSIHPSTRFVMAFLGYRLGYRNNPKMYPKIDQFMKLAAKHNILKNGLGGGVGMFHNEFIHKVVYDCRYLRKEMHVTTNTKLTFGLMLNYFTGWLKDKEYATRIPDKSEKLQNDTHVFFRGEDGTVVVSFK